MSSRITGLFSIGSLCLFSMMGCRGDSVPAPWERTDLFERSPRIVAPGSDLTEEAPRRVDLPHGLSEVRDFEKLNEWQKKRTGSLSAGTIRAVEQQTGSTLVSSLDLGEDPFFSFIPLPDETSPCSTVFDVSAKSAKRDKKLLLSHRSSGELSPPPDTITVDLGEFAGSTVDLLLELSGLPDCRAFWGSPAIYSRGERRLAAGPSERPNIVLIGVDTLRADALGAYGRTPSRTPAIDELASQSDLWTHAYTGFNVTVPSFTSMLTGLYGKHHGVYDHNTRLPSDLVSLPMIFSEAGYVTAAMLGAKHLFTGGTTDGFDHVVYPEKYFRGETPIDAAMNWIGEQNEPFFCFIHLYDPHTPHVPPGRFALGYGPAGRFGLRGVTDWKAWREPGERQFAHEGRGGDIELYAAEVAYVDRQIDRILDFFESRGLFENSLIVFVADHGENMEDHGIHYGHAGLWETTVHVPLMIRWPGREREGRRIEGLVQTIDLFPTLLNAARIEAPPSDGRDLRSLEREGGRPVVFAEHANRYGEMVRSRGYKYIWSRNHPRIEDGAYLYDLRSDPQEQENLAGRGLDEERRLAEVLENWKKSTVGREPEHLDLDEETARGLRALGYLQ